MTGIEKDAVPVESDAIDFGHRGVQRNLQQGRDLDVSHPNGHDLPRLGDPRAGELMQNRQRRETTELQRRPRASCPGWWPQVFSLAKRSALPAANAATTSPATVAIRRDYRRKNESISVASATGVSFIG